MKTYITLTLALAAVLTWTACGGGSEETTAAAPVPAETPDINVLAEAPADAVDIGELKKDYTPGEAVVVSGYVGGTLHPFVEDYAAFVLGGDAIEYCNEIPDDTCPTPWDACCDDPDTLQKNRAMVFFRDASGETLEGSVKGVGGLKELSKVVVRGVVEESSSPENLILTADSIYVAPN